MTEVYVATKSFPPDERFALTTQIRKACVSIPSNIAEGQGRLSRRDFRHFLAQARGSLLEVETQLLIACNLRYLGKRVYDDLIEKSGEISRMLHGLIQSLGEEASE